MSQQGGPQNRKLLVGLQAAEALLGLQHCSCSPSQGHPCIAPTLDVAADLPQHGYQALDRVGAAERAPQLTIGDCTASVSHRPFIRSTRTLPCTATYKQKRISILLTG